MKYQELLCEQCKGKIRQEWQKEKRVYRASKLKIKEIGSVGAEEVKVNIKK